MPKRIVPLSDIQVKRAKPKEKDYKLSDGAGLFLLVTPTGGKFWKLRCQIDGKEQKLSLGEYPRLSLIEAREKREEIKKQISEGVDPRKKTITMTRKSFQDVAEEWFAVKGTSFSKSHAVRQERRLSGKVFPYIGDKPVDDIRVTELLDLLRRIEETNCVETAHRVRSVCSQVFRYAISTGIDCRNIADDLRGALRQPEKRHYAAITDKKEFGVLLSIIDDYQGRTCVKQALQLAPLFFVRPGELRNAHWEEFDFDKKIWLIPGRRMKMKQDHIVPLSRQAIDILRTLEDMTGCSSFLFPSVSSISKPISEVTMNAALKRLGYTGEEMTVHGFRASARTMLDEELGFRVDLIEHQLAHAVKDPNGRAYNRTKHLKQRTVMMQEWADFIDKIKN